MSHLYREPSMGASYQIWFIWESGFRGEDYQEIDQPENKLPVTAMFVNGSGRNGPSL
jgi:hypothetical protein